MELVQRCGRALAEVLRGAADPLHLLFPGGSFDALDRIYRDSAFARTYNGAMRDVVRREVSRRGAGPLRVLEIGAGTGGSTGYLLDVLPPTARYCFTDVSPLFLERARERFRDRAALDVRLLDIERDPLAQGFTASSFDLIIASNVLHATADLRATLQHVRALAAPGALLMLLEGTAPLTWVDLTFGLTDGWWRFTDRELRPDHPLISAAQWTQELTAADFADVDVARLGADAGRAFATQSLIFARTADQTVKSIPLLIFADTGGVGDALARQGATRGVTHTVVRRPADTAADHAAVLAHGIARASELHSDGFGVVYLWALDLPAGVATSDDDRRLAALVTDDLPAGLLRATAAVGPTAQLWMATRGAQSTRTDDPVTAPEQAPLWGWARGFALEHPQHVSACIDLDPSAPADVAAAALDAEIRAGGCEDQVAMRAGVRSVARLVPVPGPDSASMTIRADGAYLITGGTGGIGLRVAQWLADRGAGEVVLLSRSGLPHDATDPRHAALAALQASPCTVRVVQADAGDAASLQAVLAQFGTESLPLRGVIHAAVAMSAAPLSELTDDARASMRRSKVDAARLLHQLTADQSLDFLAMFSSTTALLGVHGMAHYAAANLYLDALAQYRRGRQQVGLSVAWGTWDVMRVASEDEQAAIARGGLRQLHSDAALALLGQLLATDAGHAVVANVDWQTLVPLYEARRPRPLFRDLATATLPTPSPAVGAGPVTASVFDRIASASAAQRQPLLEQLVRSEVAAVLGYANGDGIPIDRGFFELGLDSLMSVELKRRLESAVRQSLPSTLTFNYPNVAALTAFLHETLFPAPLSASASVPEASAAAVVSADAAAHEALSDDELEAELIARLQRLR
jgi:SAM-dependent methyltransferase/NADP-dependent 3-hydroxy acid dehydrogenase YdfG/acyl carrier protein